MSIVATQSNKTVHLFKPTFKIIGSLNGVRFISELERETGFYSATETFARQNGGPIVHEILDLIPQSYRDEAKILGLFVNIDVRIHRLYPGDFPAYPGWHCDGEYRETYFSQPDLERIHVHNHLVTTISSHPQGVSNTQFLNEQIALEVDTPSADHTLWGQLHELISSKGTVETWDTKDGEIVQFNSWTPHRCMPARVRGWRLFFRMSMWHKPHLEHGGKISKQEQVYKVMEGSGW